MCLLDEKAQTHSQQGGPALTSIADGSVKIQTTSESNFSIPSWFGEVVLMSRYLQKHAILNKLNEQVRFARKRFGRVRGDRLSRGALRVHHQRGAHPGGVL